MFHMVPNPPVTLASCFLPDAGPPQGYLEHTENEEALENLLRASFVLDRFELPEEVKMSKKRKKSKSFIADFLT